MFGWSMINRNYLSLVLQKAQSDFISETRRGYMGILWWVVEPVLYLSVFYIIFVLVFNRGGADAVSFLLTGLVVWKWFGSSIPQCTNSLYANNGFIRQGCIRKMVFPGVVVVNT